MSLIAAKVLEKEKESEPVSYEKVSRIAGLISAALVATLTCAVSAHALLTISASNAAIFARSLNGNSRSGAITPPANLPVLVMGDETTAGCVGSSELTLVNSVGQDNELVWNGLESNGGGFTAGSSPVAGTHIMYIDVCHRVQLEVNNATSFIIHNLESFPQKGNVTEIW